MQLNYVKRVDRGKKKEDNDDIPLVYTKFHSWKTVQSNLKEIIHDNKNKKITISVQQMYSKAIHRKMGTAYTIEKSFKDCPGKKRVVGICEISRSSYVQET